MQDFLRAVASVDDPVFFSVKFDPLRKDKRWTLINDLKGERIKDCNLEDIEKVLVEYYFGGTKVTKQRKKSRVKKSYTRRRKKDD